LQPTRLVIDADGILLELCMINGGFLVWMIWLVIVAPGIESTTRCRAMTARRGDALFLLICLVIAPLTMFWVNPQKIVTRYYLICAYKVFENNPTRRHEIIFCSSWFRCLLSIKKAKHLVPNQLKLKVQYRNQHYVVWNVESTTLHFIYCHFCQIVSYHPTFGAESLITES
jgi:hypothetical protein